eukprot:scaffold124867_cov63-Attheya_sp.AAC.1
MDSNHNTETAQYISVMHWFMKAKKRGKEDSVVGCHFGWHIFGLRRSLCEIYATTDSLDRSNPTGYDRYIHTPVELPVGYRGCLYQACGNQYIMLGA